METLGENIFDRTLAAIDECVRNLVCVGADPDRQSREVESM